MKSAIIIIFFSLVFTSCDNPFKKYYSEVKTENGIVVAKQYQGEINDSAPNVGITTGGDISFGQTTIHTDEKFDVVFRCEHKKIFTIDNPDVYSKLQEGDSVIIKYREVYDTDTVLVDLDFIDANVIKTEDLPNNN